MVLKSKKKSHNILRKMEESPKRLIPQAIATPPAIYPFTPPRTPTLFPVLKNSSRFHILAPFSSFKASAPFASLWIFIVYVRHYDCVFGKQMKINLEGFSNRFSKISNK